MRTGGGDLDAAGLAAEREGVVLGRLLTFFTARSGKWSTPTGEAWQPALAIEVVAGRYCRTGDRVLRDVLERSFARYRARRSRFYDDDGWYLNAWLCGYAATGEPQYLDEARSLFVEMSGAWDGTCGGGLWWSTGHSYKNAITNGLFLLAAARLHRLATGHCSRRDFRGWAARVWRWIEASGMINRDDLVNDGLDGACVNNGGVTWTYNQGVMISALVELCRTAGEPGHLVRAHRIARAAITTLVYPDGTLREPGEPDSNGDAQVFKGVFVRGLAELCHADPAGAVAYRRFLRANAATAWQAGRDRAGGFGVSWRGPAGRVTAATQTAAALLFGAVAGLEEIEAGRAGAKAAGVRSAGVGSDFASPGQNPLCDRGPGGGPGTGGGMGPSRGRGEGGPELMPVEVGEQADDDQDERRAEGRSGQCGQAGRHAAG